MRISALRRILVPVALLASTHAVLAQTGQLPFEADIEKFEASDRANPPTPGAIVFVGSSSIRRWTTLAHDFPDRNVLNRGFGGSQIIDSVHFAKRIVTPYKPKMVVFFAGTNDIAAGKSADTVCDDYKQFVEVVRSELPTTPILFISITPAPSRISKIEIVKEANKKIQTFCQSRPNLLFLDMFNQFLGKDGQPRPEFYVEDKLHLSPAGYAIWIKALKPILPNT